MLGIKTTDVDGDARLIGENGGDIARAAYDDAHERRTVVSDAQGNGIVFYSPLTKS